LSTSVAAVKHGVWDEQCAFLPMDYLTAVIRAGGAPVMLPPSPVPPETVLESLSALILPGGLDVDPSRYGANPHPLTDPPGKARDEWEISLVRAALHADLPLLCICRGLQVLNVALGGTLHQHLPEVVRSDEHRRVRGQMTANAMSFEPGSAISAILGTQAEGLCHHHQGVARLGRRVRAVGFTGDGTVEAVEVSGQEFAIGVQWHPEADASDDRLFIALVHAAQGYRTAVEHAENPSRR
jgi:gamma-glutamyl-gamma-aminobutyrate hydrolase PuuD